MKKNIFYILIIFTLIVSFSPIAILSAQTTPPTPAPTPYKLLQPLPCTGVGCTDAEFGSFNPGGTNALGTYLNIVLRLVIGICAVLATIMIVIGGMEYMTSELVSSKEAGKKRITNAIFGLLLALGAYTILHQINPKLLDADLKNLVPQIVSVTVPVVVVYTGPLPSGAVASCTTGVTRSTTTGIVACSNISARVDSMVTAAGQAGLNLQLGGFRTRAEQTALRVANCKGNTTDPNAPCNPDTALPGTSNHEAGLAFDIACSGTTIQTRDNACFVWLRNNAATYGLYNLPSEPWHWSVDGH